MIVDILVVLVLLISAGIAFMRGFIRETLTIAGVVGGLAAAYFAGPLLIPHMYGWLNVDPDAEEQERLFGVVPWDMASDFLSYATIFIVVVIVLSIISHILSETIRAIGLGAVDRSFGVVFGLVRGVLMLGLIYLPFHMLLGEEMKEQWFAGSRTHFYLEQTADALLGFVPEDASEKLEKEVVQTRDKLREIDVLKQGGLTDEQVKEEENSPPGSGQNGVNGYSEQFRDNMNSLFEQESGENFNE